MRPHYNEGLLDIILVLLGIIILLLVIIVAYLWVYQKKGDKQKTKNEDPIVGSETIPLGKIDVALRLLNNNEKKIVQGLIDNGGEMLQKDISSDLGLSRVQTHRSIQSLIGRDMVISESHFNTNKIILAHWILEE